MSYSVKTIPSFERELKRLSKKCISLKQEYIDLVNSLKISPEQGTSIGNNCYKIRLSIASKGKGKRGGARVITYLHFSETTVYLLSIYDKSEEENISDKEISMLLSMIAE